MTQKVVRIYSDAFKSAIIYGSIFFGGCGIVYLTAGYLSDVFTIILGIIMFSGGIGVFLATRKVKIIAITFYDNRIFLATTKYIESMGECKYSHFQIVSLKIGNILQLQTESRKTVAKADLSYGWSISKINRILSEFKKHNKKIEIDERLLGIYDIGDSKNDFE